MFCKEMFAKEICTFLVFLNYTFCKFFWIFEMAWSRAFQKCIFYHFLNILFCKHFYFKLDFAQIQIFANLHFFADSESIE